MPLYNKSGCVYLDRLRQMLQDFLCPMHTSMRKSPRALLLLARQPTALIHPAALPRSNFSITRVTLAGEIETGAEAGVAVASAAANEAEVRAGAGVEVGAGIATGIGAGIAIAIDPVVPEKVRGHEGVGEVRLGVMKVTMSDAIIPAVAAIVAVTPEQ